MTALRSGDRPSIAVLDYEVTEQSPAGSCHLRLIEKLRHDVDFTVFANEFDNPDPERIRWVRVPSIRRPMAARYASYFFASAVARRRIGPFDLVQAIEGYTDRCDISYVHFCHRHYLQTSAGMRPTSGRERIRRLDHRLRGFGERSALTRPRTLVVPSSALRDDIAATYGLPRNAIRVIANPLDPAKWSVPESFDRDGYRASLGYQPDDVVAVFVALGHFERKGLPLLLEALASASPRLRLLVVGGTPDLLRAYQQSAVRHGVDGQVRWAGQQADVRPYLWVADVLAAPSSYETFGLALHQGAASGLPLLVHPLPGITDVFESCGAAFTTDRKSPAVASGLDRVVAVGPDIRRSMGVRAREAVSVLGVDRFADEWREVYRAMLGDGRPRAVAARVGAEVG